MVANCICSWWQSGCISMFDIDAARSPYGPELSGFGIACFRSMQLTSYTSRSFPVRRCLEVPHRRYTIALRSSIIRVLDRMFPIHAANFTKHTKLAISQGAAMEPLSLQSWIWYWQSHESRCFNSTLICQSSFVCSPGVSSNVRKQCRKVQEAHPLNL